LQAAHEAGLVHRDFKPANVLVAEDGRVRVADFGLVKVVQPERSSIDGPDVDDGDSASSLSQLDRVNPSLTEDDVVLGTPKYMAPEQYGSPALPASDQFAFCVSLWEAFVGEPPYTGKPHAAIKAKFSGPPPWPRGIAIPRRILAAIERGLSPRPEDRFASMDALLVELVRDSAVRRPLLLGLATAVAVATGLTVFAIHSREAGKCTGAESLIEATWSGHRRQRVEQAFAAAETSTADTAWEAAASAIDAYAARWAAQHREACEASTVRGEQSAAVMDRRMACLGDARGELEAVVGVFEQADAKTVERAQRLLENLPDLGRCEDIAALQQDVALPPPGEVADAVTAARADLARSRALYRIGKYEESLALADAVDSRTRDLDYPPIHAEAALGRGDVLDYLGRYDECEAALKRALQISLRFGSYEVSIKAATSLVYVVGQYLGRPAEALWPAELALDLAVRIEAEPVLEARARNAMGAALRVLARWDESEAAYRVGIRRLAEAVGERDSRVGTLTSALGAMLTEAGRYDRAEPVMRRAHEIRKSVLGDRHPDAALSAGTLGFVLMELGRFEDAEAPLRETFQIRVEALGPDHFFTAKARSDLAHALTHLGRADEGLVEHEAAVRSLEATQPEGHSAYIEVLHNYAFTLDHLGRGDEAEAQARRALAAAETSYGRDHPLTGEEVAYVAELLAGRAQLPEALVLARRAVEILERSRGPDHVTTLEARAVLGDVLLAQGNRAAAVDVLEAVWKIREPLALAPSHKAHSAFALALALTDAPPPTGRALDLARTAAGAYRTSGPAFGEQLAEVEAWIGR
jgi:tetratricopeptide (TPR) repeat protein